MSEIGQGKLDKIKSKYNGTRLEACPGTFGLKLLIFVLMIASSIAAGFKIKDGNTMIYIISKILYYIVVGYFFFGYGECSLGVLIIFFLFYLLIIFIFIAFGIGVILGIGSTTGSPSPSPSLSPSPTPTQSPTPTGSPTPSSQTPGDESFVNYPTINNIDCYFQKFPMKNLCEKQEEEYATLS